MNMLLHMRIPCDIKNIKNNNKKMTVQIDATTLTVIRKFGCAHAMRSWIQSISEKTIQINE